MLGRTAVLASIAFSFAYACSSTTTSGWGGVEIDEVGSAAQTHSVCTALRLSHTGTDPGDSDPVAAPSDEELTVTTVNGTVYIDSSCDTALPQSMPLLFGSGMVDFEIGFEPTAPGACTLTLDGPSGSYIESDWSGSAD